MSLLFRLEHRIMREGPYSFNDQIPEIVFATDSGMGIMEDIDQLPTVAKMLRIHPDAKFGFATLANTRRFAKQPWRLKSAGFVIGVYRGEPLYHHRSDRQVIFLADQDNLVRDIERNWRKQMFTNDPKFIFAHADILEPLVRKMLMNAAIDQMPKEGMAITFRAIGLDDEDEEACEDRDVLIDDCLDALSVNGEEMVFPIDDAIRTAIRGKADYQKSLEGTLSSFCGSQFKIAEPLPFGKGLLEIIASAKSILHITKETTKSIQELMIAAANNDCEDAEPEDFDVDVGLGLPCVFDDIPSRNFTVSHEFFRLNLWPLISTQLAANLGTQLVKLNEYLEA